jgi:hypothetical protein
MFERISNSWSLAQSSWHVLWQDKKLVVFPIVSGLGCLLVLISFFVPMALVYSRMDPQQLQDLDHVPWWTYLVAFAFYFCNFFVIVFCNSALISCALMHFNGEQPTLGDGFGAACSRLPQIVAWALVAATVGVLLKLIENANEKVGQFISALLGTAWSVLTYFVVPVLVVEKVGPFAAIQRSLAILRKAWGEALIGNLGLGLFQLVLTVPGIVLLAVGVVTAMSQMVYLGVGLLAVGVLYLIAAGVACSALNTIFLSALYQYAAFDRVASGFERDTLAQAFKSKSAR